jgi:hypothetical protein
VDIKQWLNVVFNQQFPNATPRVGGWIKKFDLAGQCPSQAKCGTGVPEKISPALPRSDLCKAKAVLPLIRLTKKGKDLDI